ncbi:MAG: protein rep [Crenarchaeota archaeon]|nr:protein rep [Thermoproteota archaeon]
MGSLRYTLKEHARLNYSLDQLVDQYLEWVKIATYMILTKWNKQKWKNDVFAVKCAKRGNDVYVSRVKSRFRGLEKHSEDILFFNPKDRGSKKTQALFVTLTYDSKLCQYGQAWEQIGTQFNSFMSYVRSKFGQVSSCRVFEAFDNGHPHIHCILLFKGHSFSVFRDGKGQFRVHEKDVIAEGWHSNVDVKAMSSVSGGLKYLKKYLLKGVDSETADRKGLKTLTLCWAYRKRAFSVSGQFRKSLTDLITDLHNSNNKTIQITLLGKKISEERYFLLGFMSATLLDINSESWFIMLNSTQTAKVSEHFEKNW